MALSPGAQVVVSDVYNKAPHLVSLVITPTAPSIARDTTAQFRASGTFSDNSSQDLTSSVPWSSSVPSVATISSTGLASGLAAGTTAISASIGSIVGTAQLTVTSATLVSISVTPSNPTVAKGLALQFKATGTFSDSTTQDVTSQATWASSDPAVATISSLAGSQGLASVLAESGVTTISATLAGITGQASLTGSSKVVTSITVEGAVTGEIYVDGSPGAWRAARVTSERRELTGTLLQDGRVLLAGRLDLSGVGLATAEVYDPASNTSTGTGSMGTARIRTSLCDWPAAASTSPAA